MNQHIVRDEKANSFLVSNIRTSLDVTPQEVFNIAKSKLRSIHVSAANVACEVYRKSVDARKKNDIRFVWTVSVTAVFSDFEAERMEKAGIRSAGMPDFQISYGSKKLSSRPVIVGSGPAGLFCAYLLAENGYAPILIERGGAVDERARQRRCTRD